MASSTASTVEVTAALLVGGRSTRMGYDKAGLTLGGQSVLSSLVARLSPLCAGGVMVISRADQELPNLPTGCRVEQDLIPQSGALGGLHTALARVDTPWVFAAACDMPLLDASLVAWMVGQLDAEFQALVPLRDGFAEPLHALYHVSCLEPVQQAMHADQRGLNQCLDRLRVQRIEEARWRVVHPSGHSFLNVNRPEDLDQAIQWHDEGKGPDRES